MHDDDDDPKQIGIPIRELFSMLPRLTDAEWNEREAQLAAEREADAAANDRRVSDITRATMLERGWPVLALDEAKGADTTVDAVAFLRAWGDDGRTSMVIVSGAVGCGKTVGAARWAIDRMPGAAFMRASTFARTSRYEHETMWRSAAALVLDDLGAEYLDAKGSFLVDLDELVDMYQSERRPLVITTNCRFPQFEQRYGARIVDRMRQCAQWISLSGASLRRPRR